MIAVLLVLGTSSVLRAQKNLDALRQRCDKNDRIDKTYIVSRDKQTSKEQFTIQRITIRGDKQLVDAFFDAFAKDRLQAVQSIVHQRAGRVVPKLLLFQDGHGPVWYGMNVANDTDATILYTKGVMKLDNAGDKVRAVSKTLVVPYGGAVTIDGKVMTVKEARAKGYDVREAPVE